ncbi:MAG: hypothetical protein QOD83_1308 [Solirubrobacteraceae bacterium]|nr:hypothetical protein [Solirubrobacteraceae bacterium]
MNRPAVVEDAFQRTHLLVDGRQRAQLGLEQIGAVAVETAHVEEQAADVTERELTRAAQKAQPAAQPAAVAEARLAGRRCDNAVALVRCVRRRGGLPAPGQPLGSAGASPKEAGRAA